MKKSEWAILISMIIIAIIVSSKKIQNSLKGYLNIGKPDFAGDTNAERIFAQAKKRGLSDRMAQMLVAWSKFETGNFTSHFVPDNRNYYGYTYDKNSKYQTGFNGSNPQAGNFAVYASLENSVNEVVDWMNRRVKRQDRGAWPPVNSITDPIEFATLLMGSNYSNDSPLTYGNGIKKYLV